LQHQRKYSESPNSAFIISNKNPQQKIAGLVAAAQNNGPAGPMHSRQLS
jgi:hypothetical protein